LFADHGQLPDELPMVTFYRRMFERRSSVDLRKIARVKRFFERFCGDDAWRKALRDSPGNAQALFEAKGIELDAESVAAVWRDGCDIHRISDSVVGKSDAPLGLWWEWSSDIAEYRRLCRHAGGAAQKHPTFDGWRNRQLLRLSRELSPQNAAAINSPILSYELSSGCSVGCWFCGVSADRFGGFVPYNAENARLWGGILNALVERFGSAAATGFCYWATDPSDNPDYFRFIDDHRRITGLLPPTTTAVPLRSLSLTREVLSLNEQYKHGNNRFSVLTVKALDAIHQAFDADELLTVDLVLHMKGSLVGKAKVGRGLKNSERIDRVKPTDARWGELDQGSIACVTGFLVNLPKKSIRLISPCRADEENSDGYRTYGEKHFSDVESFCVAIDELISENMAEQPSPGSVITFAPSLSLSWEGDSLMVRSHSGLEKVIPFGFLHRMVELIALRRHTVSEVVDALAQEYPDDLIAVRVVLHDLFQSGLIEELPAKFRQEKSISLNVHAAKGVLV
jgi:radical SAM family RiPP maturation amino acid epimerase